MKIFIIIVCMIMILAINLSYSDEFVIDEPNSSIVNPSKLYQNPRDSIGSVQIPQHLNKGTYDLGFVFYQSGGVHTFLRMGVFNNLSIGISENMDNLTGNQWIYFHIPAAYIKLSLFDSFEMLNMAIGLDRFAYGYKGTVLNENNYISTLYGVFLTGSVKYSFLDRDQLIVFGARYPLLPEIYRDYSNISFFAGANIDLKFMNLGLTVENFYLNPTKAIEILPSAIAEFNPVEPIFLQLILQFQFVDFTISRMAGISYRSQF